MRKSESRESSTIYRGYNKKIDTYSKCAIKIIASTILLNLRSTSSIKANEIKMFLFKIIVNSLLNNSNYKL